MNRMFHIYISPICSPWESFQAFKFINSQTNLSYKIISDMGAMQL